MICCDKFKSSLSADEVCRAIANGIKSSHPEVSCIQQPLADGGDGSLDVLQAVLNLEKKTTSTIDPLGRAIESSYYVHKDIAYIEPVSYTHLTLPTILLV